MNVDQLNEFISNSDQKLSGDVDVMFSVFTNELDERHALDNLGLIRSKLNRSIFINEYSFEDGWIHLSVPHDVLEDINYKY